MRRSLLFNAAWIFLACHFVVAEGTNVLAEAKKERDYKRAISIQKAEVEKAPKEQQSEAMRELAMLYLQDQDQEAAFRTFLIALDQTSKRSVEGKEDAELYKKAFDLYLDPSASTPQATAQKLLTLLAPVEAQPLLHFFIAIANANLGRYGPFFDHFYLAYTFYPDHYLAFKTKAVLHIKLLERTRGEEDRTRQRREIAKNLEEAARREPRDVTIYRMLISFSPQEEKEEQVRRNLNKIIEGNIIVPRSDLIFYVQEAVDAGECNLAERFIVLARAWYPQSKLLDAAQTYLDTHK